MSGQSLLALLSPLIILAGCANHTAQTTPPTVASPCQVHQDAPADTLFGYGEGASLAAAKQQAYADISAQLQVQINSESVASIRKRDAEVSSQFEQKITSQSNATFTGLDVECLDQHTNPGQVAVILRLDRRPLERKTTADLIAQLHTTPKYIHWQAPQTLANSPLAAGINEQLIQQQGTGNIPLPLSLRHESQSGQWRLQIGTLALNVPADQLHMLVSWEALEKGIAQLAAMTTEGKLLNRQIANATEYRLVLKHPTGGYAQLLGVYENGDIDLLRSNLALMPSQALIVPENNGVFEAGVLPGQPITTDTLILVVTSAPLNNAALTRLQRQGNNAALQELLMELENLKADIAILQLVIK